MPTINLPASSGSLNITVDCTPTPPTVVTTSNVNWITGTGSISASAITLTVASNPGDPRTGEVTVTATTPSSPYYEGTATLSSAWTISQQSTVPVITDYEVYAYGGEAEGEDVGNWDIWVGELHFYNGATDLGYVTFQGDRASGFLTMTSNSISISSGDMPSNMTVTAVIGVNWNDTIAETAQSTLTLTCGNHSASINVTQETIQSRYNNSTTISNFASWANNSGVIEINLDYTIVPA